MYTSKRRQGFSQISCFPYPSRVYSEGEVLLYILPEQKTQTALGRQAPPGQHTLGQKQSSGSSPLHRNSSGHTGLSDSLKDLSPWKDTALPHPSCAQMTWAVRNVKFSSDTRVQSFPECTSTSPEQGPAPPTRRTTPRRGKKKKKVSVHDSGLAVRSDMSWTMEYDNDMSWSEAFLFPGIGTEEGI